MVETSNRNRFGETALGEINQPHREKLVKVLNRGRYSRLKVPTVPRSTVEVFRRSQVGETSHGEKSQPHRDRSVKFFNRTVAHGQSLSPSPELTAVNRG